MAEDAQHISERVSRWRRRETTWNLNSSRRMANDTTSKARARKVDFFRVWLTCRRSSSHLSCDRILLFWFHYQTRSSSTIKGNRAASSSCVRDDSWMISSYADWAREGLFIREFAEHFDEFYFWWLWVTTHFSFLFAYSKCWFKYLLRKLRSE